jgi:hypothetical protein
MLQLLAAMAESRLRAELRREQSERRSEHRGRTLLSRRGVQGEWDPVPLTEVPQLVEGLKKKGSVDEALLSRLQKALLQGREWTDAFLASPGALTALVGHLSGTFHAFSAINIIILLILKFHLPN